MKLSVLKIVILLPTVVACVCAWRFHHQRALQATSVHRYRYALLYGRDANPRSVLDAFGLAGSRRVLTQYDEAFADCAFDGVSRWVQILRVPHALQVGEGDGYTLFSLKHPLKFYLTLPKGTVIDSVHFDRDYLVFKVHGEIEQGSYSYTIPKMASKEYLLTWPSGTPVPQLPKDWVASMMSADYCHAANRTDRYEGN